MSSSAAPATTAAPATRVTVGWCPSAREARLGADQAADPAGPDEAAGFRALREACP